MNTKREEKMWWVYCDGYVSKEKGFSCAPNSPDMWWIPSVGYSMSECGNLFESKKEALEKGVTELEKQHASITLALAKLKSQL